MASFVGICNALELSTYPMHKAPQKIKRWLVDNLTPNFGEENSKFVMPHSEIVKTSS